MDKKIKNALYLAGTLLVTAALMTLFKNANLIWATLMVVVAIVLLVMGYKRDKALVHCMLRKPTKKRIVLVTAGVITVFFGLGFAVGKLIYLWSKV